MELKKIMTYGVGNPLLGLRQVHKCGGVKLDYIMFDGKHIILIQSSQMYIFHLHLRMIHVIHIT